MAGAPPLVLILAAGQGTRLRPLTERVPKCLVDVGGRSILGRCLDTCRVLGMHDIVIVVGYRQDLIRAEALAFPELRVKWVENHDYAAGGTAGSTALGVASLDLKSRDLLLVEADVVFGVDLMQRLLDHPGPSATLIDPFQGHSGSLVRVRDGLVTTWLHEQARSPDFDVSDAWKTVNITRIEGRAVTGSLVSALREILEEKSPTAPLEFAMERWIEQGGQVAGVPTGGLPWFEVDTPDDLRAARSMFSSEAPPPG